MSKVEYKMEPHHPAKWKGIPWQVCQKCGLVYLRNPLTAWSIKHGCNSGDHPQYGQKRVQLVALHQSKGARNE